MIYLDNAATSYRKPQSVIDAVCAALSGMGNAGRGAHQAALDASRLAYETRCMLSDLFGGYGAENVAFTSNSTEALNTAISGLFGPEDHVITTALEHNSVLRPLYRLEETGMELTIIQADSKGCVDYKEFEKAIQPNTKAIVCTHGSNLTGNLLDIKTIGDIAGKHGLLFIVDASQTAGVFPIDMRDMQIDALCITGHKSLMAPQGIGALLIRDGLEIRPLKVGGSGIQTYDHEHPKAMPTRLEAGTLNMHGIAGLHAALQHLSETGMDVIREKELSLADKFYRELKDIPGITIYGDYSQCERAPIVSLNIRDYDSSQISDILFVDYEIQTRPGGHCAPLMHETLGTVEQGAVRFSFNWFNTEEDVQAAVNAIKELAEEN
ncbi:MAG: aminotransferase class V-fold PLP-dependent enzyme [Lachnospiraceae bacterium]|nr:aminotransferase class V-fold PLP-dependent enzyme [Lachnospiraceae bacterium]